MVELTRRGSLSDQIVAVVSGRIHEGVYKRGQQLPTEQVLIEEFKVSRTVVREAIANLKASGLVSVRQGVGVFVQRDAPIRPFFISEANMDLVKEATRVLELRIALEVEAAALAASRRDAASLAHIEAAYAEIVRVIETGEDSVQADLDFHRSVAEATGNPYFLGLFNYLGELLFPRTRLKNALLSGQVRQDYLNMFNREHGNIFEAIKRGDSDSARAAMRLHLVSSKMRLEAAGPLSAPPPSP